METSYIGIAVAALIIIVVLLLVSRAKAKERRNPANLATLGMSLVALGIIFVAVDAGRPLSYSFMGGGVLLSVIDAIRNRRSK